MPLYARPTPFGTAIPVVVSGQYQPPSGMLGAASTAMGTSGQCSFVSYDIPYARAFNGIAVNVGTAVVGGTTPVLRLGLYADDGTGGRPGTLLIDAGAVTITATGIQVITISTTLPAGRYWGGALWTWSAAPTTYPSIFQLSTMIGYPGPTYTNSYRCWLASGVAAGAMPVFSGTNAATSVNGGIAIGLRAA